MAEDLIRYDLLAQEALRGVVRRVLGDVARDGLPGDHHFYIAFDTRAPGVRLSARLRAQHPEEMTIVLQHQFWDLAVTDQGFEVGLSFGGVAERLVVPFSAVKGFFDPSVQFGLQFEVAREAEPAPVAEKPAKATPGKASRSDQPRPRGAGSEPAEVPARSLPKPAKAADGADKAAADKSGADVVSLDAFRKKT